MLQSRIFEPSKEQIIYHYCSAETLMAILEYQKIRFSDINMTNDYQEALWGYAAFERAAGQLIHDKELPSNFQNIEESFADEVDKILHTLPLSMHSFISCFSLEKDSLSQWRAYAEDGKGFAIGFKAEALQDVMPVTLLEVEYNREKQIEEMMAALNSIYNSCDGDPEKNRNKFNQQCILLGNYNIAFKHHAFKDEKEIRCLHAVDVVLSETEMRFVDAGGISQGKEVEGEEIQFQMRNSALTAFFDMPFYKGKGALPISEIVIGPRSHTSVNNLKFYLSSMGHNDVEIIGSEAPYR